MNDVEGAGERARRVGGLSTRRAPFSSLSRAFALVVSIVVVASTSLAAPPSDADRATARELGSAGLAALDAKDYATAADRFTRAIALFDAPTLRVGAARALSGLGRLVSASENYRAVLLRAPSAGDPPAIVQATRDAKRELPEVEARLAHLTVMLSGAPSTLRVDGVEWPAAAVGVARPLDPGEHVVEAVAGTPHIQSQKITLSAGENARLDFVVPAPEASSAAGVGVGEAPAAPAPGTPSSAAPTASQQSGAHAAAIVTAALAGALAAGAVVTGVMALGKRSDFDDQNRPDVAHATKEDLRSQANTLAVVSTVLTGAALVGTGLSIYFWVKPSREPGVGKAESMSAGVVFASSF